MLTNGNGPILPEFYEFLLLHYGNENWFWWNIVTNTSSYFHPAVSKSLILPTFPQFFSSDQRPPFSVSLFPKELWFVWYLKYLVHYYPHVLHLFPLFSTILVYIQCNVDCLCIPFFCSLHSVNILTFVALIFSQCLFSYTSTSPSFSLAFLLWSTIS